MPTSPRFWNLIAGRYARTPVADEAAYQHKLAATKRLLSPEMDVLEFGCGTGTTALHHAPLVRRYTGIDFSPKMIAIARDKATAAGQSNLSFDVARIEEWTAPNHGYDAILGMSILHLLEDKEAVLAKIHRLLKPGGLFISSTFCATDMPRIVTWILRVGNALGLLPLVRRFSDSDLVASPIAAGFVIKDHWRPGPGKAVFLVAQAL
jgi:ubiquinone/menaquinone biosynthesis C-methylase UbiE